MLYQFLEILQADVMFARGEPPGGDGATSHGEHELEGGAVLDADFTEALVVFQLFHSVQQVLLLDGDS